MSRRRLVRWALIGAGLLALFPLGLLTFWLAASFGSDAGSPTLAAEWRDHLNQFADPDAARTADPGIVVLRFPNGEWLFGKAQNSHGIWYRGGGTLVVKDSRGQVRAFFGHVCGSGDLAQFGPTLSSLDDYYKRLGERSFREYRFP